MEAETVEAVPPAGTMPVHRGEVMAAEGTGPCPSCGGAGWEPQGYAYAVGRIEVRFPTLAAEKEFAQVAGRADAAGQTDQQLFHAVLSQRQHRYLARQMCWVLRVQGVETYILQPREPAELDLLVESIRPAPSPADLDVVIGLRGPVAGPEACNGLMLPVLAFDQIYSFDRDALLKAIPRPDKTPAAQFRAASEEMLDRLLLLTDNAGATDEHRAVNYLAMRYPAIYAHIAAAFARNAALTGVEVRPSALSGSRRILDVILATTDRTTDVIEKAFVRVDVTEEFPFLVSKLAPFYDR
ncbi:cyanobactin maturation protease PatG family protein [Elioraea rosea]|uniref:cyanobactin maturation protease PatG family protein n=1 Tax=Elioraea rosea TaxID=2492390 RepID=UPI00194FC924|nr:hypothetical protein [Elioraea rosea]